MRIHTRLRRSLLRADLAEAFRSRRIEDKQRVADGLRGVRLVEADLVDIASCGRDDRLLYPEARGVDHEDQRLELRGRLLRGELDDLVARSAVVRAGQELCVELFVQLSLAGQEA